MWGRHQGLTFHTAAYLAAVERGHFAVVCPKFVAFAAEVVDKLTKNIDRA